MENKSEVSQDFVTRLDLLEHGDKLKSEFTKDLKEVKEEVLDLKTMVLPLAVSAEQTAKNTEKMSETLERFASNTTVHLHKHDLDISKMQGNVEVGRERKQGNTSIIVAIITITGGVIGTIIGLAPLFWN
ncbi:hypothetical protein [Listeria grandensis]|uniref:hypothetical protein n=1 Tax=Listeria grandensis TaxID=1494963 RepID=UPI0004B6DF6D|nr:hypothetical protein [Listeria grandensis]